MEMVMNRINKLVLKNSKVLIAYGLFVSAMFATAAILLWAGASLLTGVGVITGMLVALFYATISRFFEEGTMGMTAKALIFGTLYIVIYCTVSRVPSAIALIELLVTLVMMAYLVYWWYKEGSDIKELVLFIVLDLILMRLANAAAIRIIDITDSKFLIGFVTWLPKMMLVISIGYFVGNKIWWYCDLKRLSEERG